MLDRDGFREQLLRSGFVLKIDRYLTSCYLPLMPQLKLLGALRQDFSPLRRTKLPSRYLGLGTYLVIVNAFLCSLDATAQGCNCAVIVTHEYLVHTRTSCRSCTASEELIHRLCKHVAANCRRRSVRKRMRFSS
jgi:hypothetical protein